MEDSLVNGKLRNLAVVSSMLVVLIHSIGIAANPSDFVSTFIKDGICRVAVPAFFFISGYYLAAKYGIENWYAKGVAKRWFSIVVPYLIWNVLFLMCHLLISNEAKGFYEVIRSVVQGIGLNPLQHPANHPLWFMRSLFLLIIVSPIIFWAVSSSRKVAVTFLVLLYIIYGILGPWEGFSGSRTYILRKFFALQGLFYFALGASYKLWKIQICLTRKVSFVLIAMSLALLLSKCYLENSGIVAYKYLGYLSMPFLLIGLISILPSKELPGLFAKTTFSVYVIHMFVVNVNLCVLNMINGRQSQPLVMTILLFLEIYMVTLATIWFIRKVFPSTVNKYLWGGRI